MRIRAARATSLNGQARPYLVMHHEFNKVEESARLPSGLVVAHTVEHAFELVITDHSVAVLVHFPDQILDDSHAEILVVQVLECLEQLVLCDLTVLLLHQDVEDALEILELL